MPTDPSGYTTNYALRKWDDGANPGASALNANMDDIDSEIKTIADGQSETGLSKIIYKVSGVAGGATLAFTEIFNNTGAVISGSVVPVSGLGDYTITYTTAFLTGKTVLFKTQLVFAKGGQIDEDAVLRGYIFFEGNGTNNIVIRTVNSLLQDSKDVIATNDSLIFEFLIIDS